MSEEIRRAAQTIRDHVKTMPDSHTARWKSITLSPNEHYTDEQWWVGTTMQSPSFEGSYTDTTIAEVLWGSAVADHIALWDAQTALGVAQVLQTSDPNKSLVQLARLILNKTHTLAPTNQLPSGVDYYSVKELADHLRVSSMTVLRAIKAHQLPAVRVGDAPQSWYRIPAVDAHEWILSRLTDKQEADLDSQVRPGDGVKTFRDMIDEAVNTAASGDRDHALHLMTTAIEHALRA